MGNLSPRQASTGATKEALPKQTLSLADAIALIVGIVVGVGIFKTPSLIAANTGREDVFFLVWLAGGIISLTGALCYAELATAYPHTGGDYHYLRRAFGPSVGFLFVWSRTTVIQPGSIAMLAFVFGDYFSQIFSLGPYAYSLYAALAIAALTAMNLLGTREGKGTQNWLTALKVIGFSSVVTVGMIFPSSPPVAPVEPQTAGSLGLAMVFVLLTFGGWNEAVYISAELKGARRNMVRALLWGLGIITAIYLLMNLAYWRGLGLKAMGQSEAVAADLVKRVLGPAGVPFMSLLIMVSALGAINGSILTGARTSYSLGQDFSPFAFLGRWQGGSNTPVNALLFQGAVALVLVLFGTLARKGFVTMVEYTAPVFWCFFLLAGLSLFQLRRKEPQVPRPFRVPLYPFIPLFFCIICGYMLQASVAYTGVGALVGLAVLLAGTLVLLNMRPGVEKEKGDSQAETGA
jgi:APA family basic amino acid/polyamine antiporter